MHKNQTLLARDNNKVKVKTRRMSQQGRSHNPAAPPSTRPSRLWRRSAIRALAAAAVALWGTWLRGIARETLPTQPLPNSQRDETLRRQFTSKRPSAPSPAADAQRLVILAGPHKTGTSSMQANLWKWTAGGKVLPGWVWAVPPKIVAVEEADPHPWQWTPSKGFYPLFEALRNYTRYRHAMPARTLFANYSTAQVLAMYADHFRQVWAGGYHIVMGTEAMDSLVKDVDGAHMFTRLLNEVLPFAATNATALSASPTHTNVTVVIVYRTPKYRHLVSIWHQNALKKTSPGFYDWLTTTANELGALDALGIADIVLKNTQPHWNVVLVDTSGLKRHNWDISNLIACELLHAHCDKTTGQILAAPDGPLRMNVREDKKPPDLDDQVLQRMEPILTEYDCNYRHLFHDDVYKHRLRILYPLALPQVMDACNQSTTPPLSRKAMKERIVQIAIDGGKKDQER